MDLNDAFMQAINDDNEEKVRCLIASHGFCHTSDGGYSFLVEALSRRKFAIARVLITCCVQVNNAALKQPSHDTPLHLAVDCSQMDIVDMLLNRGADINAIGSNWNSKKTPIGDAITYGNLGLLELLFNRGVDLNARGPDGLRPLHIAAKTCNEDAVILLLSYGADIDATSTDNKTALCFAAEAKHVEVVKLLLQFQPDVSNERNKQAMYEVVQADAEKSLICQWQDTDLWKAPTVPKMPFYESSIVEARQEQYKRKKMMFGELVAYGFIYELDLGCDTKFFHGAIELGFLEIVEDLLTYGADVNMDYCGETPLLTAIKTNQPDIAELLVSYGADVNAQDGDKGTPIYYAARSGRLKLVKLLLKNGAILSGFPDVMKAAIAIQSSEIVKELLKYGADANVEFNGRTPLLIAIHAIDLSFVKDLLKNGADANYNKNYRGTPLLMAVKEQQPDFAELLISYGADVNARDRREKTSIYYAAKFGNVKLFNILLTQGATISDYPQVVHAAIRGDEPEIVEQLLNLGNDDINDCTYEGTPPLVASIKNFRGYVTALLLDKGAYINVKSGTYENTPLHFASLKGDHTNCETMLKKGAVVGSRNKGGRTPLHYASTVEIVELLLDFGADINARNLKGQTPLQVAVKEKREIVVDALIKFDADINSTDKKGKSALHLACRSHEVPIVRLLLNYGADINICDNYDSTPMKRAYTYYNRRSYQENYKLIIKELFLHIDKMEMINLYVSDKNLAVKREAEEDLPFLLDDVLTKQRQHCKEEIGKLQATKINNSNVTYYDFLTKNTSSLAVLLGNESILQAFQPGNANAKEFPNYAPLLNLQFRKAMKRKELVEQCNEIFQNLSNEDLQMFVENRGPPRQCSAEDKLGDKDTYDSSDYSINYGIDDSDGYEWSNDDY